MNTSLVQVRTMCVYGDSNMSGSFTAHCDLSPTDKSESQAQMWWYTYYTMEITQAHMLDWLCTKQSAHNNVIPVCSTPKVVSLC